ncbi:unnamed protein product [Closterium sp. NIES-65]|nr:unnamed protein product [Closterium sp. NIES-65]
MLAIFNQPHPLSPIPAPPLTRTSPHAHLPSRAPPLTRTSPHAHLPSRAPPLTRTSLHAHFPPPASPLASPPQVVRAIALPESSSQLCASKHGQSMSHSVIDAQTLYILLFLFPPPLHPPLSSTPSVGAGHSSTRELLSAGHGQSVIEAQTLHISLFLFPPPVSPASGGAGHSSTGELLSAPYTGSAARHSSTGELLSAVHGKPVVRAIALPESSSQLYTGSQDGTIRVWDCTSGQCVSAASMGGDVGALITNSGWLFVGLPNLVKTWVLASGVQSDLPGPTGSVHQLLLHNGMLFAACSVGKILCWKFNPASQQYEPVASLTGHTAAVDGKILCWKATNAAIHISFPPPPSPHISQDGKILCWKFNPASQQFEPVASLMGHTAAVVCLEATATHLFSGSMDKSIRIWDLSTGACVHIVPAHDHVVMALVAWQTHLLSCSLDGTVKVWAPSAAGGGAIDLAFTHTDADDKGGSGQTDREPDGALVMKVSTDLAGNQVLMVAYSDNSVRLYDLPSYV